MENGLDKVALQSDDKVPLLEDSGSKNSLENTNLFPDQAAAPFDAIGTLDLQQLEPVLTEPVYITSEVGIDRANTVRSRKRKSTPVPLESPKVLRPRSREKATSSELKTMRIEDESNETRKSGRGRKKGITKLPVNEFSRMRTHLRYLLHRINYENNLIDAYSCEGWKGQSLEKIKPEKELERARSQIFRFKLKIRDLFERLDASLNQGKLPESLFNADGKIDCEDIFCAKCGSKDLTVDNDIILCDGGCECGFHQLCLEPPLLKEQIPPGDEGWICPGCVCKYDCFDMLNDFQGSKLTVFDNWEKVFPEEAAAAASGKDINDIHSLQSEDSEDDDDYNPVNDEEIDHKNSRNDPNKSDNDMVPYRNNKEHSLGLSSDDSEDDDFDPSIPNDDQPTDHEISSAEFTSESEDSGGIVNDENYCLDKDEGFGFSLLNYCDVDASANTEKSTAGEVKVQSFGDKVAFVIDSDDAQVPGKRRLERLDYKKLHDEAYGDDMSDSSDEDYSQKAGEKRRKGSYGNEHTLIEEGHRSFEAQDSNSVNVDAQKSLGVSSSGKIASRSKKRLGEAAVQRLVECFKINQYPEKDVIESLANESSLTVQQVNRWFVNSRWSFRHTSRMESKLARISGTNATPPPPSPPLPHLNETTSKLEPATASGNSSHHGIEEMRQL